MCGKWKYMKETDQKIIDAIIKKAEIVCPGSLALIGLYGSVATGDVHEKSDLDLLILINDARGQQLADGFILNDIGIGYDLYCTSWEMLEEDAQCNHAHLSKLLDSKLVYTKDSSALERLDALRKKATDILSSDTRYSKAQANFENAKKIYADCFLADSISQIRICAGAVIHFLLDAVMLCHGKYFQKGVKRTFDELALLNLPFDIEENIMSVVRAETAAAIQNSLTVLMRNVQTCFLVQSKKATPCQDNLSGTYEEMFSNWRNKMWEAVDRNDLFSSFMNMVSFQHMICEIAESVAIHEWNIMDQFNPHHINKNAEVFDTTLDKYLETYQKAGIPPKRFIDVNDFLAKYLKTE